MAEIELINVSKSWGNFNAVIDFNLIIKDKEFLVLLGPSGCGKSTLLKKISRGEVPGWPNSVSVEYVEQEIEKRNPNLISQFNNLICEYGFDWEDDYSDSKWDIKEIVYYRISNEFPKIVGSKLSSGIEDVSYTLDMNELKDFEITKEVFLKEI